MKSERQNKYRDMLVLVMHLGKNFPDIEDLEKSGDLFLLASDLSYSLFEATELLSVSSVGSSPLQPSQPSHR